MKDYTTTPLAGARRVATVGAVCLTGTLLVGAVPAGPAAPLERGSPGQAAAPSTQAGDADVQRAHELFIRALQQARDGQLEEALATAREGLDLTPDDADGLNLFGQIHEGMGHEQEARDAYQRAIAADPEYLQPRLNLVVLEVRTEHFADALVPVDEAIALAPDEPRLHALRGVALRNVGRLEESAAAFERAWELAPDNGDLAVDVSVARGLAGDEQGAMQAAERAVELAPELLGARLNLARLLAASTREDELVRAPGEYREALELAPEIPDIWLRLADVYSRLAMHADAEAALRRAIDLGAAGAEVQMDLAQALFAEKQYAEAAETFARAADLDPSLGEAWFLRSESLMNLDRSDEALEALQKAAAAMPNDPAPRLAAAQVLLQQGDLEGVEREVQAAVATGRDPGRVQLTLGRLRQRQGRLDDAIAALRAAVASAPDLLEARYLLGQCLVQAGHADEGREALADYQRRFNGRRQQEVAAERANVVERARIHGVRARVYLAEDRPADAVAQLEAAAELTPENPAIWRLLMQAYEALGNDEEAARARSRLEELQRG